MKYDRDPVVEEVRKIREGIMRECGNDPHTLGLLLAAREEKRRCLVMKEPQKKTLKGTVSRRAALVLP
jgi:hypothetical protein